LIAAAWQGLLNLFTLSNIVIMIIGVIWGLIIGVLPGLGGLVAMSLLIPFIYGMNQVTGICLLIAAYASVTYGGALTAILLGTPGEPANAATIFDGYQMTKKGKPLEALAMAACSSALGGFIGVISLIFSIPILRSIMMYIGSCEYALLALTGIAVIGMLQAETRLKGIISGLLGLMISFVGYDPVTGVTRFTFGRLELMDGFQTTSVLIGLFALAEMFFLFRENASIVENQDQFSRQTVLDRKKAIWDGIKEPLKRWPLLIRGGVIGAVIGLIPGLGGNVAAFVSYGQAKQTSKYPELFGTGIPDGVIAPESANNAKDGGALIPTLAFGVPGSAGMAVIMGALIVLGMTPGPEMLTTHLSTVFSISWALAFGALFSGIFGLIAAMYLVKLILVPSKLLVPFVTIFCLIGSFCVRNSMFDVVITVVFGLMGYLLKHHGFSTASVIVGLLLGKMAEQNIAITQQAFGWSFLTRPVSIFLILAVLTIIIWPMINERKKTLKNQQ
jgi:putative tricarboxylic transport membrane protein